MSDGNEHFAQAGAWDHFSNTFNFCEEDYAITPYIAEFINTISNIAYVYYAFYPPGRGGRDRLDSMSWSLVIVGITSALFHATLRLDTMFGDDFSMWILCAAILRPLYCRGQSPAVSSVITIVLTSSLCLMAALHMRTGNVLLHTSTFAVMLSLIWPRTLYLIYGTAGRSEKEKGMLIRRFLKAVVTLVVAFILWNIDLQACLQLRDIRHAIGLPWAWTLELHGWWHVLTALGAADYITLPSIYYIVVPNFTMGLLSHEYNHAAAY